VRDDPLAAQVLEVIARDEDARDRVLDYARHTDRPDTRVAMLDLARDAGWLTREAHRDELAAMLRELQSKRDAGVAEVNLACRLNADHSLDGRLDAAAGPVGIAQAAMRACLGNSADRAQTLRALLGPAESDVQLAQAYLRYRPVDDTAELRDLTKGISAMPAGPAQVRALETLGRHYVSDGDVLHRLLDLYAQTPSSAVQSAVAGILLRADRSALPAAKLRETLISLRREASRDGGAGTIDALITLLGAR
jgi:hypothetical protein